MMGVFSRIDLLSTLWAGPAGGQSRRMVDFMVKYMGGDRERHSLAVKIWRHALMHTARPRALRDPRSGKTLYWLLHWGEHLPKEQHYTYSETDDRRILNLALLYLVDDLERAARAYLSDLAVSPALQRVAASTEQSLGNRNFRPY